MRATSTARRPPSTSTPPTTIRRTTNPRPPPTRRWSPIRKGEEGLTGAEKDAWHRRATDAGVKFAQTFPEHPDSAGVLTRAAEEIFAAGDRRAPSACRSRSWRGSRRWTPSKQRIAWTIIGQSHFDQGDYAKAEPAYLQARQLAGADDKMHSDLTERLAASVYKQGEAKQQAGDAAGAVDDYLRVARLRPSQKIRANAQYDAAAQLINLKQWERAIEVLEGFRRDFPQSELQPTSRATRGCVCGSQPPGRGGGGI